MNPYPRRAVGLALLLMGVPAACTHKVKVDPIKVEPIDITLHVYLEADERLDSFFDYQQEPAAPQPEPAPAEGGPS